MKGELEQLIADLYRGGIMYSEATREFKKRFIEHVLLQNRLNQCKAARELGMHRNTLRRTIAELGLDVRNLRYGRPVVRKEVRKTEPVSIQVKEA
jgi:Fis family transcriptional regulator, factor for inversion stimulation protein